MIVLRLRGGLGNQLFQFAAAKSLAEHHQSELKLDLYYYSKHPYRKFELDKFNLELQYATRKEVHNFTGSNPIQRYLNKRENYLQCPAIFAQPHYHFYPDFFSLPHPLYLSGYFQSEKYFKPLRDKLVQWYTPRTPLDTVNVKMAEAMSAAESVGVHVRKGDYVASQYTSFFGSLSKEYYTSAIQQVQNNISNPVFFILSDDVSWCKSNLNFPDSSVYVDHNMGEDSYKDLILMSHCRHNIIANSSFSWWGAWLNQNTSKVVIAPKQWFRKDYFDGKNPVYPVRQYNTNDLIPEGWIQL